MKAKLISFILLSFLTIICFGQEKCNCCSDSNQQFDFWIGDWIVKDTTGTVVGENRISKIEDDCVVLEQWKGNGGSTGTSMNYYNKLDKTWNQLWVDNQANILKLKGDFTSGEMVLKSDLIKGDKGDYYNQITWSENKDGTVMQLWEVLDVSNNPLKTLFLGIYHRKQ
ncbi:MAG: hypothetical protein AAF039_08735 [Bacteroidota bacterium]